MITPPAYIASPTSHFVYEAPEIYYGDDVVLNISYNILLPQEREEQKRALCLWINSEGSNFPLNEEQTLCLQSFARRAPGCALSGHFAFKMMEFLQKGKTVEEAAEQAFQYLETEIAPRYLDKASELEALENIAQNPELKQRYQPLKEAVIKCATAPRETLKSYYSQRILANKTDKAMLNMLLTGSIGRHPVDPSAPSPLRQSDYWQNRKKALFQTIDRVRQFAPHAPFILSLQEVTAAVIPDFKAAFKKAHLISYNNGTGKRADEPLAEDEQGHRETLTSTIILSKEFKIIREELGDLPNISGVVRRILGVEVINKKTGKHLAVFECHADHIPSKEQYANTAAKIHEFVTQFLKKSEKADLPFIFSGDLNTFQDRPETIPYINSLRNDGPFKGSHDYREGSGFHCPAAIAQATFLGQPIDDFKLLIDNDGTVQPNAFDHSLLSKNLDVLWGLRDAGVYDESLNYVDPYVNPKQYIECLKKRQTASDHFLIGYIFRDGSK